ncbi:hypothetical protein BLNAU_16427 [Blattamonas nauphoetae]|uniref:DUF4371 domain-containing protein n=1 Tax=Blattamonas nauphoetae TaxID=2049346 RepID=A0ABQ9X8A1_9EUKA|nr:hypothetical protein BLNAU_16427 [Blattamonas nauphoetae]
MDVTFHDVQTHDINERTPVAITLDTSTDQVLTSVLAVNLRLLSKRNEIVVLLVGIKVRQIVSISTDGDPAMIGSQKGFRGRLKEDVPLVFHLHCGAHRFNLSLKETFDSDLLPMAKLLVNNCILIVHSITKSATYTRNFLAEMIKQNQKQKKLSKPLKIRWQTCQATVADMMEHGNMILSILSADPDQKVQSLISYFRLPEAMLLLQIINYLLKKTMSPLLQLQSNELTLIGCREVVETLRRTLNDETEETIRKQMPACFPIQVNDPMEQGFTQSVAIGMDIIRFHSRYQFVQSHFIRSSIVRFSTEMRRAARDHRVFTLSEEQKEDSYCLKCELCGRVMFR